MCTGAQVREARRLLGWSTERLAGVCGVTGSAIRTYEPTRRMMEPKRDPNRADRVAIVRTTLEEAGVVFLDGEVPGVRLQIDPL